MCKAVADPLETALAPHMCYHAEFSRSRSNRVHKSGIEPPEIGIAGTTLLGTESVVDLLKTSTPYVLPRQIWSFYRTSRGVGINTGNSENWGALGRAPPP